MKTVRSAASVSLQSVVRPTTHRRSRTGIQVLVPSAQTIDAFPPMGGENGRRNRPGARRTPLDGSAD
jgi:hypothetical protein